MPKLIKNAVTTYIPGDPGNPGSPAVIGSAGYWSVEDVTTCGYTTTYTTYCGADESLTAGALGSSCVSMPQTSYQCTTTPTYVYHAAVSSSPGVPYSAPTAAQINVSLNVGWNSYARTIGKLDAGKYLNYSVKIGTTGALLALGYAGKEGDPISAFTHGLMTDISTTRVFENGVPGATLGTNAPDTKIHIARMDDGRIVYSVGNVSHISTAPAYLPSEDLYVYGMLYSGYDEVSSAAFVVFRESTATISGTGSLSARAEPSVRISGAGTLFAVPYPTVTISGTGSFLATAAREKLTEATISGTGRIIAYGETSGRGYGSLPLFVGNGGDTDYIQGYGELPLFVSGATNGQSDYVPPEINRGYANMPFFVGAARGVDIGIGTGSADLPLFVGVAGDYDYGFARSNLPMFFGAAYSGFIPDDTLMAISPVLAVGALDAQRDIVMIFTSTGQLASTLTLDRIQALELLSAIQAASTLDTLGIYGFSVVSGARVVSMQTTSLNNLADLPTNGVVWVVNQETSASSQYEGYGFNSFFTRAGVAYGVAADGVYRLEGATDAGAQIDALANIGKLDMATALQKMLPSAYIAASSTDVLKLEVDADGTIYTYETRSSEDGTFKQHRVDLGRGLKANMLGLTLKNKDGADFEIASVDLLTAAGTRRI